MFIFTWASLKNVNVDEYGAMHLIYHDVNYLT